MTYTEYLEAYRKVWYGCKTDNPNAEFAEKYSPNIEIRTNKDLSDSTVYAIWWFNENNFSGALTINNTKKTEFEVNRDNVSDVFTLTVANQNPAKCDIKAYMNQFEKSFRMLCEIQAMKVKLGKS